MKAFASKEDMIQGAKGEKLGTSPQLTAFEQLLEAVIPNGRFQWRLIIYFMTPFSFLYGFAEFNAVLLLSTPDHVCHVPGRENTNLTLEVWHNLTVPWEEGPDGAMRLSQCQMHNITDLFLEDQKLMELSSFHLHDRNATIECSYGWDYDTTNWKSTPITEFDWVCDDKKLGPGIYSIILAGSSIGTVFLSMLSDKYGRRPMFLVSQLINLAFAPATIFATSSTAFYLLRFLVSLAFYTLYQMPYLIVLELCSQHLRSITTLMSFIAMVFSSMYIALVAWLTADWKWFLLLNHLPVALYLFYWPYIPESPRWLLSQGRLVECEKIMSNIASVNGTAFTDDMRQLMRKAQEEEKNRLPATKIFSSFVLTKHLILTCLTLGLTYCLLVSINWNVHNMTGNLFVNFFVLAVFEIPGNSLGVLCSEYIGRRLGAALCMALAAAFNLVASFLITETWVLTVMCGLSRMFAVGAVLITYLQIGELFPTSLRATAYGITGVIGLASTVAVPSLMALGTYDARLPYYIMVIMGSLCMFLSTFLPETLGHPLPQTLKEAKQIGRTQPYFSFVHKWNAATFAEQAFLVNTSREYDDITEEH